MNDQERAKKECGEAAALLVESGMRVGLGTGSTVRFTTEALGAAGLDIICAATSRDTEELAQRVGLRVESPDEAGPFDIAIDGADEVDPAFNLTKGGGGALTREKIVAAMATRFVVVADESKLVPRLGPFGTPIEILDFAPGAIGRALADLGALSTSIRPGRSDNGNLLLDAQFGEIDDPVALGLALIQIPGVVEHGIFPGSLVADVLVGRADGVESLARIATGE